IRNHAGKDESDRYIEQSADCERPENSDRHIALGVRCFLSCGRHGIKPDVREKDDRSAAHDPAPPVPTGGEIGRYEFAPGIGWRHPILRADEPYPCCYEDND